MKMQGQHKKLFLGSLRASRAIKNKQNMYAGSITYYVVAVGTLPVFFFSSDKESQAVLQCLQYEQWAGPQKDPK